jgi:acyl carrier protein
VGDYLDLIELMLQIEDQYGIEIPDEEFDRLITVQDIHEYVTSLEYESGSI